MFAGSAAASGGGFGMLTAPPAEARPARVFAAVGACGELLASRLMEHRMGLIREVYEHGAVAHRRRASELLAGSALQRFGVFEAGVESTKDPRYTMVPQRERLDAAARGSPAGDDVAY